MPDIEAVAEPSPVPPLLEPSRVDVWLLLEWCDRHDLGLYPDGGFWIPGGLYDSRERAMTFTIHDPRRERIVHITEPKGDKNGA